MTKTTIFLSSSSILLYSPWSGYTRDIQKYIWALFLVVPLYNLHVIGEDSLPPIHTRIGARAIHQKFLFNSHILGPYHTHSVTSPLIYTHREDVGRCRQKMKTMKKKKIHTKSAILKCRDVQRDVVWLWLCICVHCGSFRTKNNNNNNKNLIHITGTHHW